MIGSVLLIFLPVIWAVSEDQQLGHCGPKDVNGTKTKDVVRLFSRDVVPALNNFYVFKNHKGLWRITEVNALKIMLVGTNLSIPFWQRAEQVHDIYIDMGLERTALSRFATEYETAKMEMWARVLSLLKCDPAVIMPMIVKIPFEKKDSWGITSDVFKRDFVWDAIKETICPPDHKKV